MRLFPAAFLALFLSLPAAAAPPLPDPLASHLEYLWRFDSSGVAQPSARLLGDGRLAEELLELAVQSDYPAFLRALHARNPRLFRNHVLVYDSRSLQGSSPEHPRIILFDEGTFLSLRESPVRASREVELLAWDPATRRFQTAEIRFPHLSARGRVERNPPACQACHGVRQEPIFLPYDFWPGVYGSNIGRPLTHSEAQSYRRFIHSAQAATETSAEHFLDFSLTLDRNPRGLHLSGVELFSEFVTQLSMESWKAEFLRRGPEWQGVLPAVIASSAGCFSSLPIPGRPFRGDPEPIARRLNEALGQQVLSASLVAARLSDNKGTLRQEKAHLLRLYARAFDPSETIGLGYLPDRLSSAQSVPSVLRRLIFEAAGLPAFNFSPAPLEMKDRLSSTLNADAALTNLLGTSPELLGPAFLRELGSMAIAGTQFPIAFLDCEKLAAESRTRLARFPLAAPPAEPQPLEPSAPLPECASCHSEAQHREKRAPYIPFDQPAQLQLRLQDPQEHLLERVAARMDRTGRGRMPPTRVLTPEERGSVIDALYRIRDRAEE